MKVFTYELQETQRCISDNCPERSTTLCTHPTRAVSPHSGHHPKFILFQHQVFFKLYYSWLFSPKGVPVQGGWVEGWSWLGCPRQSRMLPTQCLPSSRLLFPSTGYISSILHFFHICTFHCFLLTFRESTVWHLRYSVIIRTKLRVFLRYFRPTLKGMTFV